MLAGWNALKSALAAIAASALMDPAAPLSRLACGHGCFASILNTRGDTLLELGWPAAALACYERARQFKPKDAVTYYKRGNALLKLGRPADAADSYSDAVRRVPGYADAHYNRGLALQMLRQPEAALASFDSALRIKPDDAEALTNRGNVLLDLKRPAEALASFDRALDLKPDYAQALHNQGIALLELKRPADAACSYGRLLEMAPDFHFVRGKLLHSKMLCCDWDNYAQTAASIADEIRAGRKSAEPFGYQAISTSPGDLQRCAEIYAAEYFPASPAPLWSGEKYANARIRIGYVAGEFREQATAFLITEVFELHDKNRFELFAFDNGWDDGSEIRGRINRAFGEIVDITRMDDGAAAALIRQRRIDILINLNGYFGRERQGVFSLRPCPVQVNYLGFPGTLGAHYMDYILADRHVIPPDEQAFYAEKVVYLPHTYQANDTKRRLSALTPARSDAGLPEHAFVFCCFNNNYKITPAVFAVWMRLLNKIEGSVLWLYEDNPAAARNLRHAAAQQGIAPERLVFAARMKLDEHLSRHQLADLFLDTLPYNAHTTASDALWAGLPLLTCRGTTFPGRVAASLLDSIGLPELITDSLEAYETLALKLAADRAMLAALRVRLERNRATHPLFDPDRLRRHIELAYTTMHERRQRGEAPAGFTVSG